MGKIGIPIVTLILVVVTQVISQVIVPGACPKMCVKKHFEIEKYLGKWYEYSKYPSKFEVDGKCITTTFSSSSDSSFSFFNELISKINEKQSTVGGVVRIIENGVLGFRFPSDPSIPEARYSVLSTNYKSYAVVFNCIENAHKHVSTQNAWILTRKPVPAKKDIKKAYSILKANKISTRLFEKTDQTNCPFSNSCKRK